MLGNINRTFALFRSILATAGCLQATILLFGVTIVTSRSSLKAFAQSAAPRHLRKSAKVLINIKNSLTKPGSTKKSLASQGGFTLPELIMSISLMAIISVSLLAMITNYFATMTRNNRLVDMTVNSQNLLRATVEELRYGAGVRQTNTVSDPNAPVGGWNTSNSAFVIIIAVPAVDSARNYIIDPLTGSPYNNELVYFKQGTVLYKRTLAHLGAVGNTLKTSCPEAIATPSCPADKKLIDDLNTMVFILYDQDDNVTTDPLLARSIKINLSMSHDTFGAPLTLDNSIQTTLRNRF